MTLKFGINIEGQNSSKMTTRGATWEAGSPPDIYHTTLPFTEIVTSVLPPSTLSSLQLFSDILFHPLSRTQAGESGAAIFIVLNKPPMFTGKIIPLADRIDARIWSLLLSKIYSFYCHQKENPTTPRKWPVQKCDSPSHFPIQHVTE